ncbi:MAG: PorV/PorQ family protein [Bacteroidia bacterium]|nr:PorV/PorQ family protein [Bacteroidia bacterium]
MKYSNEFLKIGVGARAAGLGNAQSASVADASASYWNPAALVSIPSYPQLFFMHSEYFAGVVKYDYGAIAFPIATERRLGIGFLRMGIDDIPNTLRFYDGASYDFARITRFSIADMALWLSYAQPLRDTTLSIGGSIKVIHRVLGPFATAWGFGVDAGVLYRRGPWRLALAVYDASSTFNAWSFNTETFEEAFILTGNAIPQNSIEWTRPSLRMGLAFYAWRDKRFSLMPTLDLVTFTDGQRNTLLSGKPFSADLATGMELRYKHWAALRIGATTFQRQRRWDGRSYLTFYPTAGIGIKVWHFRVDYALANFTGFSQNMYAHLVSVALDLPPSLTRAIFTKGD